jgi:hypothetical protein
MELVIYSPAENQFIQKIEFNFEEIRQEMIARLARYKDLVYGEESIKEAKVDRAALNKFKDALDAKRKEVKALCLAPYEEFEAKIRVLTDLIDEPIKAIDGQVKAYENLKRADKKAQILDYYNANIGGLEDLLPFDRIFSEKWLNATVRMKEIEESITGTIERVQSDLKVLDTLQTEFELQVKDTYLQTLDLSAALREKERLEKAKAAQEEYKRRLEAQEAERKAEDAPISKSEPLREQEQAIKQIDFRVWATAEQLAALKAFLKDSNIKYGPVPKGE